MDERCPNVSIVTPFLDPGRFFQEALDSVLGQTYTNWELLLIDDGSTDGSTETARSMAARCPERVRYFEHSDRGNLSAIRNKGIAEARGQFIAFLDADDVWLPEKLERQVAILDLHPQAAMVYGPLIFWYSWTGKPEDARRDFACPMGDEHDLIVHPPKLLHRQIEHADGLPGTCSALVRRAVINEVGGFEESFRGMYEDEVFFSKIALRYPVYVTSVANERYRRHRNSFCARAVRSGEYSMNPKKPNKARGAYLRWLHQHIEESGLHRGRLMSPLADELAPFEAAGF